MNPSETADHELQTPDHLSREELIDQVAEKLPNEVRAEYYRILRYCRSLPQNDEMLIVMNVMQLLALLIVEAPHRMAMEREKLEQLLAPMLQSQERMQRTMDEHQDRLDQRLVQLSEELIQHLSAERIAAKITESLRQQFTQTTIPETAKLLETGLDRVYTAAQKFEDSGERIHNCHYSAAADAVRVTQQLRSEAEGLAVHHWSWAYALAGLALLLGFLLGVSFGWWACPAQAQTHAFAPQLESPAPVPPPPGRPSSRR